MAFDPSPSSKRGHIEIEEDDEGENYATEEEEEEEDEEPETKRSRSSSSDEESAPSPPREPRTGIIHSIYVENFMCHRRFEIHLNKSVNFVTGQNGSGKSAILAAIQICLGAGARHTARAANLRALIRRDGSGAQPTHAKVVVRLWNQGSDAYQHDVYGDTITIERTIAHGSGNGYKIMGEDGREVTKQRKDLMNMLDHL